MATYIPGSKSYMPEFKPFTPDYKFLSSVLDIKTNRYNTNYQQLNDMYSKIVYAPLSRQHTQSMRDQYTSGLADKLQKISGMDLSLIKNVDAAKAVFKPFFEEDIIVEIDTFDNENMADYGRDWIIIYDGDSIFDPNKDIIWERGKDSIVLNIRPINDDIYERTETLGTGFIGVSAVNRVAFINTGIYSNLYDDDPMPTASVILSPDSITENSETTTVKLTLSNPSKFDISLGLTAEDSPFVFDLAENNKDYIFDLDTLTFPALSTEQEFSVTSIQDSEVEGNEIAVINIEGTIVTGEATYNVAGSDTIVKNIRKAIKDNSVKALVLRVNSPGGDVWASELITNALNEFKSSERPIVTSMGDIAASGGVWVTTLSDEIWAKNETITGSIGVYGIIPTLDGIYEWAGIQVDGVSSTKAGEWDERLPMPEYVNEAIQAGIDHTYDKFVSKVAENRDMPYKEILSIAGGRIWSGEKAVQLGLVDKIGDLDNAIESAANFAELDDYKIISYSKEMDPFDIFINELLNNFGANINLSSEIKMLGKFIETKYKFINPEKKINTAIYCFECEYFSSK